MNIYDYSECDEVAANMPLTRQISYSEARELVKAQMPNESETVICNTAFALATRSLDIAPTWKEVTRERFDEMLRVVPPAAGMSKGFLVGEPMSQTASGKATFTALVRHRGRYYESVGSMTVDAWLALDPATVWRAVSETCLQAEERARAREREAER